VSDASVRAIVRNEIQNRSLVGSLVPQTIPLRTLIRMSATLARVGTADYAITATTFTDVDPTNLRLSLPKCSGSPIRVRFGCFCLKGTTYTRVSLAFDGVEVTGNIGLAEVHTATNATTLTSIPWTIPSPTPGNHYLTLQARVDAGTGTIFNNGVYITMEAEEV
jgi:hypothetical protein